MSEKAGKGSLKGNDDSSAKSKRGRKVKYDTSALPEPKFTCLSKSDGKYQRVAPKGDWTKVGKGDKVSKSGKTPVLKEPQPLELKIGKELPENAMILMDCEAAHIIEGIQEQMVVLSEDPTIKIPVSFSRGLQYAKAGSRYTNPESVRQLLVKLKKHGVSDGEVCVIANICPENIDEVFALVPSLKAKRSSINEPLNCVLNELAKLKKST